MVSKRLKAYKIVTIINLFYMLVCIALWLVLDSNFFLGLLMLCILILGSLLSRLYYDNYIGIAEKWLNGESDVKQSRPKG